MSVVANIKFNVAELRSLRAKIEQGKGAFAKVGVLGKNAGRNGPLKLTNPEVGIVHEKGSMTSEPPIPRRSFLEDPLVERLPLRIVEITPAVWMRAIQDKGLLGALGILGVVGENIVQVGFETGGYGKWKPLSPRTIARKGSSAILIETAQLRKSISSEVVNP